MADDEEDDDGSDLLGLIYEDDAVHLDGFRDGEEGPSDDDGSDLLESIDENDGDFDLDGLDDGELTAEPRYAAGPICAPRSRYEARAKR
jgi:hypothetical protein